MNRSCRDPSASVGSEIVQKIQHWISALRVVVVIGRRVNVEITVVLTDHGFKQVMVDRAVWDVVHFPWKRGWPRNVNHAARTEQVGVSEGIDRIDGPDAVNTKNVF